MSDSKFSMTWSQRVMTYEVKRTFNGKYLVEAAAVLFVPSGSSAPSMHLSCHDPKMSAALDDAQRNNSTVRITLEVLKSQDEMNAEVEDGG